MLARVEWSPGQSRGPRPGRWTGPMSGPQGEAGRSSDGGRGVLDGAFRLLDTLCALGDAGLTALAAGSGLPKATAHRLLEQLVRQGAVERAEARYRIGPRLFQIGQSW